MNKLLALTALCLLAACEIPQQPLTKPAPGASYAPLPARGTGGQDFSRMNNPMEVTPCGYTSTVLYKCDAK